MMDQASIRISVEVSQKRWLFAMTTAEKEFSRHLWNGENSNSLLFQEGKTSWQIV
jgi:hypothetical protein